MNTKEKPDFTTPIMPYTPAELADLLGITPQELLKWVEAYPEQIGYPEIVEGGLRKFSAKQVELIFDKFV